MLKAVIFDMDGVLIDSVARNWEAYNEVLGRYGAHVPDEDLHTYVGMSTEDQVPLLNEHFGLQLDMAQFVAETSKIKARLLTTITPKPGVAELLQELTAAGIPVAVGTSTGRLGMQDRLHTAGLYDFFAVYVCEEDVQLHKPHPEVWLRAAEKLGVQPAECLVIEDAPSGLQAAHAAGMRCVVVETPVVPHQFVHAAELVVPTLEQLDVAVLRSLFTP